MFHLKGTVVADFHVNPRTPIMEIMTYIASSGCAAADLVLPRYCRIHDDGCGTPGSRSPVRL